MFNLSELFKGARAWAKNNLPEIFSTASKAQSDRSLLELKQPDGSIHVFTDGSNSIKKARLGMGWVIKTNPDDELIFSDRHERIDGVHIDSQNIAAEIMAVTRCLQTLPEGSKVKLHTDLGSIIGFVNDNRKLLNTRENHSLRTQWDLLSNELERHESVVAIYASDNDRCNNFEHKRMMRIAHNLAADASGARTQKPLLDEEASSKYGHLFRDDTSRYGSSPNALDIFD